MALPSHATPGQRFWHVRVRLGAGFGFAFLLVPIFVIIPISFSSGSFLNYPLPGFSLKWYEVALSPFPWLSSFQNRIVIAVAPTVIATVLGTLAAVGLQGLQFPLKPLLMALLISPMVVPLVITALALYFFFAGIELLGSSEEVRWERSADALTIQLPQKLPGKIVNGFRITTLSSK